MHRIAAKFRPRTMGGHSLSFKAHPKTAFMSGDNLQTGRLADDGQVGLESARRQSPGPGLTVFLIDQSDEDNLGGSRSVPLFRNVAKRAEHGSNRSFGVA